MNKRIHQWKAVGTALLDDPHVPGQTFWVPACGVTSMETVSRSAPQKGRTTCGNCLRVLRRTDG